MANMTSCRFRNTLSDLRDCAANMDHVGLDEEETLARLKLIELCHEIAANYADDYGEL